MAVFLNFSIIRKDTTIPPGPECNEADCIRVAKFLKDFGCIITSKMFFKTCTVHFGHKFKCKRCDNQNYPAKINLPVKVIPGVIATNVTDYFPGPVKIIW